MLWFALSFILGQTPQAPPRDVPQTPQTGTGTIRGRVTAADTGLPLHRAFVSLSGGPLGGQSPSTVPNPPTAAGMPVGRANTRTSATNADGRFEFSALPAGTYRLRATAGASRGHYLALAYGARDSMDGGRPIELAEGQQFEANVAVPRGGAIVGRVVDDFGEAVSRVMVYPLRAMPGGSMQRAGGGLNQTDDLGRFRLFGLEPGEYAVAAEARNMGPPMEGIAEGFVTTYFPSALNEREASRVRVAAARDTGDVEIVLVRTRTFKITGTVLDSKGQLVSRPNLQLVKQTDGGGFSTSGSVMEAGPGKFIVRDVVPGDYRVMVTPWRGPRGESQSAEPAEYGSLTISVASDIEDLVVVTQPGATIAGAIVIAEGTPPKLPEGFRVFVQPAERMMSMGPSPTATPGQDFQFTLKDLFGPQLIRAGGSTGYALKAVMLGATDITDTPVEFKREHSGQLRIVMTSRVSTLEGAVTDDRGEPSSGAIIIALHEDKASWKVGSSRFRMTGTAKEGRFTIPNMLAGRYFVVAVPRGRVFLNPDTSPEIFEALVKEATTVVVGEDDKRTLDLRVARGPQER